MAWATPTSRSAGYTVPHTVWNSDVVDNPIALRAGAIAIASQAANEVIYASSTTQLARNSGFTFDGTTLTIPGRIAFPSSQSASSGANTLDDYEEGTFAPTWSSGGSAPAIGNGTLTGEYIKIGKQVVIHITLTGGTTTTWGNNANSWTLTVPFAANSNTVAYVGVCYANDVGTGVRTALCYINAGGSTIAQIVETSAGAATGAAFKSDTPFAWTTGDNFQITLAYTASA